jgi:succinate dehydrogenase/fumarate reductase flavoprotein subunit
MCEAAPSIIHLLDRMGVMFNRTPEGLLDFRRFGGTQHHRTAFAGATTGQQLLYALDEQVRRYEVAGLVTKYEGWEFLGAVIDDDGVCRGITGQDLTTMEMKSFRSDAVIMATGGPGIIFGKSTNSVINTGSAASIVYQQGVHYANGEFIQIHPTADVSGRIKTVSLGISLRKNILHTETLCLVILQHAKFLTCVFHKSLESMERTWFTLIFLIKIRKSLISNLEESLKSMRNSWVMIRASFQ